MILQEYEQQGGCAGCAFYGAINIEGIQGCTFNWDDDESDDWNWWRNCEEISEQEESMSELDFIVYGIILTITLIGTTEFVIGLILLREHDKQQKDRDRDKENGEQIFKGK